MDFASDSVMEISVLLISVIIGATVVVLVYIINLLKTLKTEEGTKKKDFPETASFEDTELPSGNSNKPSKKRQVGADSARWRSDKAAFTHPWLLTSLKGHTGRITDIDFSNNGKFLATSAEDPSLDSGGADYTGSSGSECPALGSNSCSSSPTEYLSPKGTTLSRRQRKNRFRADNSPIQTRPKKNKSKVRSKKCITMDHHSHPKKKNDGIFSPLLQHIKLNLPETEIFKILWAYVLTAADQYTLGYPFESVEYPSCAMIHKEIPRPPLTMYSKSYFDVNAREFVPAKRSYKAVKGDGYQQTWMMHSNRNSCGSVNDNSLVVSGDSGQGSGSSSPQSVDSDTCESTDMVEVQQKVFRAFNKNTSRWKSHNNEAMKKCVRCSRNFQVCAKGEYITTERCLYHPGKVYGEVYKPNSTTMHESSYIVRNAYSCCKQFVGVPGCQKATAHVWSGVVLGDNGPYDDFVRTQPLASPTLDGNYGVYAIDCEMCYTSKGLEVTKISVVATDGKMVYDTFVKPENDVICYNTIFSGITAKDLLKKGVKTLKEVQMDLLELINAHTILIGHGLENDLRALKLLHGIVVDTSIVFPSLLGFPFRSSLKQICHLYLQQRIQEDASGHCSYEDARATMELMLYKIKKDCRVQLDRRY